MSLDGTYPQHLLISRGAAPVPYPHLLGPLAAGEHRLVIERDAARSAKNAGAMKIERVEVRTYAAGTPEHEWLAQAPFVHARPGTVERFSDLPIHAWAERAPAPAVGFRYSIIFSHEDGGTPTDRLMATWGRTTDVEFVYGTELYAGRRAPPADPGAEPRHPALRRTETGIAPAPLGGDREQHGQRYRPRGCRSLRRGAGVRRARGRRSRGRDGQEPVDVCGDVGGTASRRTHRSGREARLRENS